MKETIFVGIVIMQLFFVIYGKWGKAYGLPLDIPLAFHIPYQAAHTILAALLLRPWGIFAEFVNQFFV